MSLQLLIDRELGIQTRRVDNPLTNQIGLAATKLLEHNPNRVAYLIINLGNQDAFVYFDESVATDKGILLSANGGFLNVLWRDDLGLPSDALYGITTVAPVNILVTSQIADSLSNIGK